MKMEKLLDYFKERNETMKVAVIGLGSMGQRRIRLIKQYNETYEIFGIDTMEERCKDCREKLGIKTYPSISEMKQNENVS